MFIIFQDVPSTIIRLRVAVVRRTLLMVVLRWWVVALLLLWRRRHVRRHRRLVVVRHGWTSMRVRILVAFLHKRNTRYAVEHSFSTQGTRQRPWASVCILEAVHGAHTPLYTHIDRERVCLYNYIVPHAPCCLWWMQRTDCASEFVKRWRSWLSFLRGSF